MTPSANRLFRMLPQIGELLGRAPFVALEQGHSRDLVAAATRLELERVREELRAERHTEATLARRLDELPSRVSEALHSVLQPSLRRVINATGVILQTNLGRAPLSAPAVERVSEVASGYCNLEYDLHAGERSRRDLHVEELILQVLTLRNALSDCALQDRAAAVVNNCAAATFLALNTLSEGGEVLVSRGELVEIGGGFRVPDILRKSGAVLREVGTTNRTRISDYAEAITPETRLILRVHRSNFRIEGFTEQPALEDLIELGRRASVPVFEDQGTGCVIDLNVFGVPNESSWLASVRANPALVACSGDKLLGGPQCGILVGSHEIVKAIRSNPLFRALRVDKFTYAALEATLQAYLLGKEEILPAIAMIRLPADTIRARCLSLAEAVHSLALAAEVVEVRSVIGGGTTPGASLASYAVALRHSTASEQQVAARLRRLDPPVLGRIHDGRVLLDLRTVFPAEDGVLARLLMQLRDEPAIRPGRQVSEQ